jgi:predicted MPP superfamily phosphohydrolase
VSFQTLFFLAVAFLHAYLYWSVLRRAAPSRRVRWAGAGVLLLITGMMAVRRLSYRLRLPADIKHHLDMLTYAWVGVVLCAVVVAAAADVVRLCSVALRWVRARVRRPVVADCGPADPGPADPGRRRFLAQAMPMGVLIGGGLNAGYGAHGAFAPPEVTQLEVPVRNLPANLEGFKLVQLSDIHVGYFVDQSFVQRLVDATNRLRPDLVAITGDLVDGSVHDLGGTVGLLSDLQSRYGTHFVTGNHEYYSNDIEWCAYLERLGIEVLRNRRVEIGDAGGSFDLVGVDDWSGARRFGRSGYDLQKALAGRDPESAGVLLAHQPLGLEDAQRQGIGLQLSGHTHGGQIFPMNFVVGAMWDYYRGLYGYRDAHIYVSRGCGFWGPPVRVGSPPEIVELNLVRA